MRHIILMLLLIACGKEQDTAQTDTGNLISITDEQIIAERCQDALDIQTCEEQAEYELDAVRNGEPKGIPFCSHVDCG